MYIEISIFYSNEVSQSRPALLFRSSFISYVFNMYMNREFYVNTLFILREVLSLIAFSFRKSIRLLCFLIFLLFCFDKYHEY